MSDYVIVRINEKLIPEFQINYNSLNSVAQNRTIGSWSDILVKDDEILVLLLSANLVYNTCVNIPSKNDEIIRQSIPNAIEEELASDIEDNHYAYTPLSENLLMVSVASEAVMSEIQSKLAEFSLVSDFLYSEIFACPESENNCSICKLNNNIAIVNSNGRGSLIRSDMISGYHKLSSCNNIIIYSDKPLNIESGGKVKNVVVNISSLLAKTITSGNYVNLFQGKHAKHYNDKVQFHPLKKLFALTVFLTASWMIINLWQLHNLSTAISDTREQQRALLKQYIPDITEGELKDPYSSMLSRLKQSSGVQNSSSENILISALTYLGKTLAKYPDIKIQSLRLRDTKIEVKLQSSNIAIINNFQNSLEQIAMNLRVRTGTRDSSGKGISATITLEKL